MVDSYKRAMGRERVRAEALLDQIEADLRSAECDMARLRKGSDGDPMLDAERLERRKRRDAERIRSGRGLIYKNR